MTNVYRFRAKHIMEHFLSKTALRQTITQKIYKFCLNYRRIVRFRNNMNDNRTLRHKMLVNRLVREHKYLIKYFNRSNKYKPLTIKLKKQFDLDAFGQKFSDKSWILSGVLHSGTHIKAWLMENEALELLLKTLASTAQVEIEYQLNDMIQDELGAKMAANKD